ncbi:hypothetical protein ACEQ8H_002767 [Pleosporales sp. CAS-2024a]
MTAPVAEFRCLFTTDVRRKQKRWQDGYLRFHTFNSRVMVTDQARNHVGDTYWKESSELHEGDELSLDKGVLVEVAEAMGITQTDLAPLLAKKKDPPNAPPVRPAPAAATRAFQRPSAVAPGTAARPGLQLKHRSLNTLLGTPKGPVGKAVPMQSPYEARTEKQKENHVMGERAPKRQKTAQRPTDWRASSPVPGHDASPPRHAPSGNDRRIRIPQAAVPRPAQAITISSEPDLIPPVSSDVSLPSTPARIAGSVPAPPVTSAQALPSSVLAEPVSVPVETPKPVPQRIRLPKKKPAETPQRPVPPSSPPVSASNRITNVDFAVQPVQKKLSPPPSPPHNPKAKSLRLSTGVKRGTLLCQTMARPVSRIGGEPRASALTSRDNVSARSGSLSSTKENMNQRDKNCERSKEKTTSRTPTPLADIEEDVFDDPQVIHGLMDQQLLLLSPPTESHSRQPSSARREPVTKPATERSSKKTSKAPFPHPAGPANIDDHHSDTRLPSSKPRNNQTSKTSTKERPVARPASPPVRPTLKPSEARSRDASPTHSNTAGARSRTFSAMKPPSAGGIPKRAKRIAQETATAMPLEPVANPVLQPEPEPELTNPPPHPLRSHKRAPLMTTTELAALLAKPTKRPRAAAAANHPIQHDDAAPHPPAKSPARKIRRVRSENDAPIPTAALDWEMRNLPHTLSPPPPPPPPARPLAPAKNKNKSLDLAALIKRTDPRKKMQRAQSLSVDMHVGTGLQQEDEEDEEVVQGELQSPVMDRDVGPWSTEAFDLFDWRPPVREEC